MRRQLTKNDSVADLAARGLAVACGLNLNGLTNMLLSVGNIVSLVMLATSLVLIVKKGMAATRSRAFLLLLAALISYLMLATLFYDPLAAVFKPMKYYRGYGGAILIIWALTAYTVSLPPGLHLEKWLRFLRNTFLVAAASVWASPILYQFYVNLPLSFAQRMGGFFVNPNEAAMASLLAVAFVISVPFRRRVYQIPLLVLAVGAVVLTFSKTGMSALIVLLAWHLVRQAKGVSLLFILLGALFTVIAVQDINVILEAITNNPIFDLQPGQKARILAVGDILSGQINEVTSTHRTYMWRLVLDSAQERFPLGSGLGSAHTIVGGMWGADTWYGVHNSFLMILGESGPLPLGLLIASIIALAKGLLPSSRGMLGYYCLFILVVDMMATHGALATRYHNLMLAVVAGLTVSRTGRGS